MSEFPQPLLSVYVYVKVCVPRPASTALKIFPATPFPEKVPPCGEPELVKSNPDSVIHASVSPILNPTNGLLFTIISSVAIPTQPFPSVKVYVIVCGPIPATLASKFVPVTPVPE